MPQIWFRISVVSSSYLFLAVLSKQAKMFADKLIDVMSDLFECMACQPPSQLQDLDSVQKHFSTEHSVPDLLSSRATRVVALPSSLSCHTLSCTLPHKCLLCQPKGGRDLPDEKLVEHMAEKHGKYFLETWQQFCTFHCRWGF